MNQIIAIQSCMSWSFIHNLTLIINVKWQQKFHFEIALYYREHNKNYNFQASTIAALYFQDSTFYLLLLKFCGFTPEYKM